MKAQQIDWSDIPFVLAVCEVGSLSGAARLLDVNHSTVFRRIAAVESRLGVRLFERLSQGYVMTPAGEHFYREAQKLRDGMHGIQRELSGQDLRLEGALSVTTTDSLLQYLMPVFADFQTQFPDIELRLLSDSRSLDLMQRDADIAIRPTANPPDHWSGRRVGMITCAAYAHRDYWEAVKDRAEESRRWVTLDVNLKQSPMSQMTAKLKPPTSPVTIVNTVLGMAHYVRSGDGLAVLPCYHGDAYPELVRICEPDNNHNWELWILSHPDLRRSARVHAFFEFVGKTISNELK